MNAMTQAALGDLLQAVRALPPATCRAFARVCLEEAEQQSEDPKAAVWRALGLVMAGVLREWDERALRAEMLLRWGPELTRELENLPPAEWEGPGCEPNI